MRNRKPITYANVVSTIALCVALSGGVAVAASQIGTSEIKAGAVTTHKIAPGAVTAKRLADHAIRGRQLARRAVETPQLGADAVTPRKMRFPVFFAASPTGGSAPITGSLDPYPLQGAQWSQRPGQIHVIFGEADATLAYDGNGSGSCQAYFDIRLNGTQVGGGSIDTSSTSPTAVTASLGAQPLVDPTSEQQNDLEVKVGSNGDCTPASQIDSSRFRVLDFG